MSENSDKALQAVEQSRTSGKIRKGTNEVTKSVERGQAKLVVVANDVSPKEIIMHLPLICKEKGILCIEAGSKEELGAAAGLGVSTVSVAVIKEGNAKAIIEELSKDMEEPAKVEVAVKTEVSTETAKEEVKEDSSKKETGKDSPTEKKSD